MTDPAGTDPDDRDPSEVDLSRRSGMAPVSLWALLGAVLLVGMAVYGVSAVL